MNNKVSVTLTEYKAAMTVYEPYVCEAIVMDGNEELFTLKTTGLAKSIAHQAMVEKMRNIKTVLAFEIGE